MCYVGEGGKRVGRGGREGGRERERETKFKLGNINSVVVYNQV